MTSLRNATIGLAATAALLAIGPAAASASQVWMDPGARDRLVAGGGEINQVTVDVISPTQVKFTELDGQGITQTNCQVQSPNEVLCNQPAQVVQVLTGSFDDSITVNTNDHKLRVLVDSGKDADTVVVNGTPASDIINTGLGEDHITASEANSFVTSGPLLAGGSDVDTVDTRGGYDSVHGGDDGDTIVTGDQNDTVYGEDGNDSISLGAGDDKAWGGNGGDTLVGGLGIDQLRGQAGDDSLDAVDGVADATTDCGPGSDWLLHDAVDPIANGCEQIQ
jgi:Ca2+-binding RTX toxin-like protein